MPKPATVTATDLDPEFQAAMAKLLERVAPGGGYTAAKAPEYVAAYTGTLADASGFAVTAGVSGDTIKLAGSVTDKAHHDRLIDLFVAMRLVALDNAVTLPPKK